MANDGNEQKNPVLRVKAWAEKTGLPLELSTRLAFEVGDSAFAVESSVSFVDPESGKGREIDVVATCHALTFGRFDIAIECKASDKPWLVVVDEKRRVPCARVEQFGIVSEKTERMFGGAHTLHAFSLQPVGLYLAKHRVDGFSFKQAFSNKDSDDAYSASMSALKASVAIARSADRYELVHFVWPVVVVDSPIIVCSVNAGGCSGAVAYSETDCAEFAFTAYLPEKTSTIIRVVRRGALPDFVKHTAKFAELLSKEIPALVRRCVAIESLLRRFPESK